jgi:hypothetical protein
MGEEDVFELDETLVELVEVTRTLLVELDLTLLVELVLTEEEDAGLTLVVEVVGVVDPAKH